MINVQFPCLCVRKENHGNKNVGIKHCIGTRHRSGWKDEEMAVGIPAEQMDC